MMWRDTLNISVIRMLLSLPKSLYVHHVHPQTNQFSEIRYQQTGHFLKTPQCIMCQLLTTQHVPVGIPSVFGTLSTEEEIKHEVLVNTLGKGYMVVAVQRWYWTTVICNIIRPHKGLVLRHVGQSETIHHRPEK